MGLREVKASRTREGIQQAALGLFEANGYEQTTMEQIADAAQVGIATLYRYFPTKDQILLEPVIASLSDPAALLAARPADEPLEEALGQALHVFLTGNDERAEETERLRAQLDRAPGPRARLWDLLAQQRTLLENAIAERAGEDPSAIWVGVAAHMTMMIAEMALDLRRSALSSKTAAEYAEEVIALLQSRDSLIPRLPR
jgi:AcrR family transcriptional regulator